MASRELWSLSFGRWKGVHVQLHMFFLLFAVLTYYLVWMDQQQRNSELTAISIASVVILFLSVLLHEIGHCIVARRLGGSVDSIVLGPLGGMRPIRIPHDPQSELLAVVAGPMTSLAVCLVCFTAIAASSNSDLTNLLNPLAADAVFDDAGIGTVVAWPTILRLTCWINWILVVVNMIPAFPFDGGRACKAFLQSVRPDLEPRHAVLLVGHLARMVALGLLIAAVVFRNSVAASIAPTWLALVMLSIFVFFITRVEELQPTQDDDPDDGLFGYDFSQGYTSLARSAQRENDDIEDASDRESKFAGWLSQWKQKQEEKRCQIEAEEDRRLDEILARLHDVGEGGLSPEERNVLKRVSARYRSREKS